MSESSINVTEGSGKRLHTWDRTISAVVTHQQFVLPGEFPYPSYSVVANSISTGTADSHIVQLMAGSSKHVRIRRIRIEQQLNAGTASYSNIRVLRLTTAGTGGSSITPEEYDPGDAAAGATAMSLPSSKGTEGGALISTVLTFRQTIATSGTQPDDFFEWVQHPGQKPIIIPAGSANGIAIRNYSAIASASVTVNIEFVETDYL